MVRADVNISNVFLLRPEGTNFRINATATDYTVEDWGDDTVGLLRDNDAALLTEFNPMVMGLDEARTKLSRKFDIKLEKKFPRNRFGGNCILSRIGQDI